MKKMNVEKVAKAIEADAGHAIPGLREGLAEAKAGKFVAVHTPESIAKRVGRPPLANPKEPVKLRLDADVLAALRATGDGWQTRINDTLRANLVMAGRL